MFRVMMQEFSYCVWQIHRIYDTMINIKNMRLYFLLHEIGAVENFGEAT